MSELPELNKARLEYLRGELRAERISWGELAELQSLRDEIAPGDLELLEAAGVSEYEATGRGEGAPDERPNLIERLENLIAALEQDDKDTAEGIAGEMLTMIDGR